MFSNHRFHEATEQRYRFHKAIAQHALMRAVRSLCENGNAVRGCFVKTVTDYDEFDSIKKRKIYPMLSRGIFIGLLSARDSPT